MPSPWWTVLAGLRGIVCPGIAAENSLKCLGLLSQWPEKPEKLEKKNDSEAQNRAKNDICPVLGGCQIFKFLGIRSNTNSGKTRLDFYEMPVHKTSLKITLWDTGVLGN